MNNKPNSFYLTLLLTLSLWAAVIFFMVTTETTPDFKIYLIVILVSVLPLIPLYRGYRARQDEKANIPLEDEMSRLLQIHAGAYAFRYSMMSWFAIFIFRDKFPDTEEMLGIGILAAATIYGLCWLYMNRNGLPHADQD